MKRHFLTITLLFVAILTYSQTLYVPAGTSGIGTSGNGNVGIGTTNSPYKKFTLLDGPVYFGNSATNKFESGRIRMSEYPNNSYQGAFIHYDGSSNLFHIGVHNTNDALTSSDVNAISIVRETGKVGIGTNSPSEKLTISGGNIHISNAEESTISSSAHNLIFSGVSGGYAHRAYTFRPAWGSQGTTWSSLLLQKANTSGDYSTMVRLHTSGVSYLNGGNVGIGTTSPDYKLDVEGTIRAHEIKVNLDEGADFVFEEDYNLMPLNELETFVKTQKHLPEVAPAKEMEAEGLNISEMNIKLLQKIEELTLYTIEQEKRIEELEGQHEKFIGQDERIKKLEKIIKQFISCCNMEEQNGHEMVIK